MSMKELLRVVSWNIHGRTSLWESVAALDVDVALLQEAPAPPAPIAERIEVESDSPWRTGGAELKRPWRTTIVRISNRVRMSGRHLRSIDDTDPTTVAVSRTGSLAIAEVALVENGETVMLASMYGAWEHPDRATGSSWIYADASVHRLISDLSALIGRQRGHQIIAAGDLNILHGHGEDGNKYWRNRYQTIFSRMEALGLVFVGPQAPHGGLQASPWPKELPRESKNVPTFRTKQDDPASATRQLDFVFASGGLAERLRVRALNRPSEWGPSDHCQVLVELKSL